MNYSSSRSKGSPLSFPIVLDKDNDSIKEIKTSDNKDAPIVVIRHARSRRSMDTKPADRLGIFGAAFGGTLGKGRKPPSRFVWQYIFFVSFLTFGSCY